MTKRSIVIATRESPLALWQAEWVKTELQILYPDTNIDLLGLTTSADRMLATPLREIGGKGLFVKELEEALLDRRADIAVHSMKDVPMEFHPDLLIPVICEREDPRDAFVSNKYAAWEDLPLNAIVGTSSLRRRSQLCALRPDLVVRDLRGNVNTRLAKLDHGEFDAIILAAVGLKRLGFEQRIREYFSAEQLLPAAGQGALGIECRKEDAEIISLLDPLNHLITHACVRAERAMCRKLEGNCRVPIAAYAISQDSEIMLRGLVANIDGSTVLEVKQQAAIAEVDQLGKQVATTLLEQGADKILYSFKTQ